MLYNADHDVPLRARVYIALVIAAGAPAIFHSLYVTLSLYDTAWLLLALATIVASSFPISIPPNKPGEPTNFVTISDVFLFGSLLFFGPESAVIISALDGLVSTVRGRISRLYKHLFNIAVPALSIWVTGKALYWYLGTSALLSPERSGNSGFFLAAMILSPVSFLFLNSAAVAVAIAFSSNRRLRAVWRSDFLWASLATMSGASVATLVFLSHSQVQNYAIALAVPIILVIYYAYRLNTGRITEAQEHATRVSELYHSTIASLAMAIDAKDQCTHGHVHRVQGLALGLARRCGFDDPLEVEGLRAAALLHDIGKLAVPEYILNKPSGLTVWEMQKMRAHPTVGADILESVPFPYPVVPYVRCHHEKWDGTGYPAGVKGTDIPLGARILSLADCYDALRSDRPYRPKLSQGAALDYIRTQSAKAYDPDLVDVLVNNIDELEAEIGQTANQLPRSVLRTIEATLSTEDPDRRDIARTVFHDIASAHKEIQAVYDISQTVGKSLNVSETLALLASKIQKLAPYNTCAIFLLNSQNDTMTPYQVIGEHGAAVEEVELKVGDGVTGWVAANQQTLINVSPAPDFVENRFLASAYESCLCLPLTIENRVLGVVSLYSVKPNAFNDDHLRLMETIAPQAASAINNSIIYEETQEDAYTDVLTGLPNLRYFKVFGEQELKRAIRVNYPVSFLMMDLEAFKSINDRYGHRVGDRALIEISHILRNQMRKSDTCIRYGGDEFVGILPGVNKQLVEKTKMRIQEAVDQHRIILNEFDSVSVGISLGSATFPVDGYDLDVLLAIADHAMYRDKLERTRSRAATDNVLPFDKREKGS